jgi:hypothetical protein
VQFLLRSLLVLVATAASLVLLELGLTVWYVDLGEQRPNELVEEFDSPFIFKARVDPEGLAEAMDGGEPGKRILSYGDSIAAGYGLDASETYGRLLEEMLNRESSEPVRVFNMARGFSPTTYSFHARIDAPRLQPDGVVMEIELLNDVSDEAMLRTTGRLDNVFGLPLEIHRSRYTLGWDGHILAPLSVSGSFIERTKVYAKLSRWAGRVMNRIMSNPVFAEDSSSRFYSHSSERWLLTVGALGAGFDRLFDSILATQMFLESQGVKFLLVILPSRHVFTDDQYTESSIALLKRAEARAREKQIHYVSAWEELGGAGGADLFMDFCHPTAEGNRVIADILYPILAEW